ncbi:CLUMA_CG011742, isoform A [Clunio marinus]|uniref:CLUMA_CG011742, isoform A n=1 Tax=Clunio marinus TaxID=568069 RepID=A0A1J1IDM5_9DIPT|nr:CLUMA_CG011742, isoform A [Clunio marinus]
MYQGPEDNDDKQKLYNFWQIFTIFTPSLSLTLRMLNSMTVLDLNKLIQSFVSKANTKSRDFIVVPRNLIVELNALEKQTDENYFENLKNHRWARRMNTNAYPAVFFMGKLSSQHWKCSLSFIASVEEIFFVSLTLLQVKVENISAFSAKRISPPRSDNTWQCHTACLRNSNFMA